eukprot:PhM_4_TR3014/c2_g1_i1/m.89432
MINTGSLSLIPTRPRPSKSQHSVVYAALVILIAAVVTTVSAQTTTPLCPTVATATTEWCHPTALPSGSTLQKFDEYIVAVPQPYKDAHATCGSVDGSALPTTTQSERNVIPVLYPKEGVRAYKVWARIVCTNGTCVGGDFASLTTSDFEGNIKPTLPTDGTMCFTLTEDASPKLNATSCGEPHPMVCNRSSGPSGTWYTMSTTHSLLEYTFINLQLTRDDAVAMCADLHAHLAYLPDSTTASRLGTAFPVVSGVDIVAPNGGFWVGAKRDKASSGTTFTWDGGYRGGYTALDDPSSTSTSLCLVYDAKGNKLNPKPCTSKYAFSCVREKEITSSYETLDGAYGAVGRPYRVKVTVSTLPFSGSTLSFTPVHDSITFTPCTITATSTSTSCIAAGIPNNKALQYTKDVTVKAVVSNGFLKHSATALATVPTVQVWQPKATELQAAKDIFPSTIQMGVPARYVYNLDLNIQFTKLDLTPSFGTAGVDVLFVPEKFEWIKDDRNIAYREIMFLPIKAGAHSLACGDNSGGITCSDPPRTITVTQKCFVLLSQSTTSILPYGENVMTMTPMCPSAAQLRFVYAYWYPDDPSSLVSVTTGPMWPTGDVSPKTMTITAKDKEAKTVQWEPKFSDGAQLSGGPTMLTFSIAKGQLNVTSESTVTAAVRQVLRITITASDVIPHTRYVKVSATAPAGYSPVDLVLAPGVRSGVLEVTAKGVVTVSGAPADVIHFSCNDTSVFNAMTDTVDVVLVATRSIVVGDGATTAFTHPPGSLVVIDMISTEDPSTSLTVQPALSGTGLTATPSKIEITKDNVKGWSAMFYIQIPSTATVGSTYSIEFERTGASAVEFSEIAKTKITIVDRYTVNIVTPSTALVFAAYQRQEITVRLSHAPTEAEVLAVTATLSTSAQPCFSVTPSHMFLTLSRTERKLVVVSSGKASCSGTLSFALDVSRAAAFLTTPSIAQIDVTAWKELKTNFVQPQSEIVETIPVVIKLKRPYSTFPVKVKLSSNCTTAALSTAFVFPNSLEFSETDKTLEQSFQVSLTSTPTTELTVCEIVGSVKNVRYETTTTDPIRLLLLSKKVVATKTTSVLTAANKLVMFIGKGNEKSAYTHIPRGPSISGGIVTVTVVSDPPECLALSPAVPISYASGNWSDSPTSSVTTLLGAKPCASAALSTTITGTAGPEYTSKGLDVEVLDLLNITATIPTASMMRETFNITVECSSVASAVVGDVHVTMFLAFFTATTPRTPTSPLFNIHNREAQCNKSSNMTVFTLESLVKGCTSIGVVPSSGNLTLYREVKLTGEHCVEEGPVVSVQSLPSSMFAGATFPETVTLAVSKPLPKGRTADVTITSNCSTSQLTFTPLSFHWTDAANTTNITVVALVDPLVCSVTLSVSGFASAVSPTSVINVRKRPVVTSTLSQALPRLYMTSGFTFTVTADYVVVGEQIKVFVEWNNYTVCSATLDYDLSITLTPETPSVNVTISTYVQGLCSITLKPQADTPAYYNITAIKDAVFNMTVIPLERVYLQHEPPAHMFVGEENGISLYFNQTSAEPEIEIKALYSVLTECGVTIKPMSFTFSSAATTPHRVTITASDDITTLKTCELRFAVTPLTAGAMRTYGSKTDIKIANFEVRPKIVLKTVCTVPYIRVDPAATVVTRYSVDIRTAYQGRADILLSDVYMDLTASDKTSVQPKTVMWTTAIQPSKMVERTFLYVQYDDVFDLGATVRGANSSLFTVDVSSCRGFIAYAANTVAVSAATPVPTTLFVGTANSYNITLQFPKVADNSMSNLSIVLTSSSTAHMTVHPANFTRNKGVFEASFMLLGVAPGAVSLQWSLAVARSFIVLPPTATVLVRAQVPLTAISGSGGFEYYVNETFGINYTIPDDVNPVGDVVYSLSDDSGSILIRPQTITFTSARKIFFVEMTITQRPASGTAKVCATRSAASDARYEGVHCDSINAFDLISISAQRIEGGKVQPSVFPQPMYLHQTFVLDILVGRVPPKYDNVTLTLETKGETSTIAFTPPFVVFRAGGLARASVTVRAAEISTTKNGIDVILSASGPAMVLYNRTSTVQKSVHISALKKIEVVGPDSTAVSLQHPVDVTVGAANKKVVNVRTSAAPENKVTVSLSSNHSSVLSFSSTSLSISTSSWFTVEIQSNDVKLNVTEYVLVTLVQQADATTYKEAADFANSTVPLAEFIVCVRPQLQPEMLSSSLVFVRNSYSIHMSARYLSLHGLTSINVNIIFIVISAPKDNAVSFSPQVLSRDVTLSSPESSPATTAYTILLTTPGTYTLQIAFGSDTATTFNTTRLNMTFVARDRMELGIDKPEMTAFVTTMTEKKR